MEDDRGSIHDMIQVAPIPLDESGHAISYLLDILQAMNEKIEGLEASVRELNAQHI